MAGGPNDHYADAFAVVGTGVDPVTSRFSGEPLRSRPGVMVVAGGDEQLDGGGDEDVGVDDDPQHYPACRC